MKLHIQNVKKTYDEKEVLKIAVLFLNRERFMDCWGETEAAKRRCLTVFPMRSPVRGMF